MNRLKGRPSVRAAALVSTVVLLVGCDARSGGAAPPPVTAATASVVAPPTTVAQVFVVEADEAGGTALATSAQNAELDPSLRVGALRRLEELGAERTVQVAASLAGEPPGLVRDNAVATLVRLNAATEIAALGSDSQALARALAERAP